MTCGRLRLTTRLQLFFLVSMATVLFAFSVTLFFAARADWMNEIDERLEGAVTALSASVEMHEEGVEWEPQNRLLHFGTGPEPEQIRWAVYGDDGKLIDHSENLKAMVPWSVPVDGPSTVELADVTWRNESWRSARRVVGNPREHIIPQNSAPGRTKHEQFAAVQLTAALPVAPIDKSLHSLAWFLIFLSGGVWTVCALVGGYVCRQALKPLLEMARDMEQIPADQPGRQLPLRQSNDELDNLATSFNDLLGRFQVAYGNQRRFAADASHQLRTPLAVMLGQVEVALRRERPTEEYRRVLELVHRRIVELQQIMESLLLLARSQEDAQILDRSPIDLREFIPLMLDRRAEFARSDDVSCRLEGDQSLVVVAHQQLLEQAIGNLLDNAARYSPPGTPILVACVRRADEVCISVDDQGRGISAEDLPRIFEPFFSGSVQLGEKISGAGGAGLGLAVAKRITEVFHGSICAEKSQMGGARFVMSLPSPDSALPATQVKLPEATMSRSRPVDEPV